MPTPNPSTRYQHAGGAKVTFITSGINAAAASCTIDDSAGWPDGAIGPFFVVIDEGLSNMEKILVASRSGNTLNFSGGVAGRGVDDTTPADHNTGAELYPCITKTEIDQFNEHAASSSGVHGAAGAVLGTTDVQNVSNKAHDASNSYAGGTFSGGTFSGSPNFTGTPQIADFTSAQHDHGDADDAGLLPTAAPAASAVGDSAVTGTAATYSRTDHKHAREGFGAVTAETSFGTSSANGSATTVARSDHAHGNPQYLKFNSAKTSKTTNTVLPSASETTIVTAPAVTTDGSTDVKITVVLPEFNVNDAVETGPHTMILRFKRDGSTIQTFSFRLEDTSILQFGSTWVFLDDAPSAASHTYSVTGDWGGSASCTITGSGTKVQQIMVEQFGR